MQCRHVRNYVVTLTPLPTDISNFTHFILDFNTIIYYYLHRVLIYFIHTDLYFIDLFHHT